MLLGLCFLVYSQGFLLYQSSSTWNIVFCVQFLSCFLVQYPRYSRTVVLPYFLLLTSYSNSISICCLFLVSLPLENIQCSSTVTLSYQLYFYYCLVNYFKTYIIPLCFILHSIVSFSHVSQADNQYGFLTRCILGVKMFLFCS